LKRSFTAASLEADFTGVTDFMAVDFMAAMDIIGVMDTARGQPS
jgi:hypothetical protein